MTTWLCLRRILFLCPLQLGPEFQHLLRHLLLLVCMLILEGFDGVFKEMSLFLAGFEASLEGLLILKVE
jgi:hypothetical protein